MNILRWYPFPGALAITSYNVYRSIIGFKVPIMSPLAMGGKTLKLRLNGGPTQTITFDGISSTVDKINETLVSGRAYLSAVDSNFFYVRSNLREAPGSIQIVGGTALLLLGLTPRTITAQSESVLAAVVSPLADPTLVIGYSDPDGSPQDFYAVSAVDASGESPLLQGIQPVSTSGNICVLEGIVVTLQGTRVPDALVTARLIASPQNSTDTSGITLAPVSTLTKADGRFSLPLLQLAQVFLEIPVLAFSKNIEVPAKDFEFVTDLLVDLDYRYPLESEV